MSSEKSFDTFDIGKALSLYTKKWKLFVAAITVFLVIGFVYLRYAVPQYASMAKIQILLDDNTKTPELSLFDKSTMMVPNSMMIDDEIEVLNSRSNFVDVAKNLGLNLKFYVKGKIRDNELYGQYPLRLNFLAADSLIFQSKTSFDIEILSRNQFSIEEVGGAMGNFSFGNTLKTSVGDLVLTPNTADLNALIGQQYRIEVQPLFEVAEGYKKKTIIIQSKEYSSIIHLNINDPIPQRGKEILAELIKVFNANVIRGRKEIADKTERFINDRIQDIYANLSEVEESAENFKASRGLADLTSQSNVNISASSQSQRELEQKSTQLSIANSMKDFLETQSGFETLPANIGLADNAIANTTEKYNQLALERRRLLESSNEKSPTIINLDQQLKGLKQSLWSSLTSMSNSLGLQVNNLEEQLSKINSKIYSAPKNERALREITRQQQTKESLYLYLLQKREESQITFASKSPKSIVVDRPYSILYKPVSPKGSVVLLSALVLGLLLPVSFIYIRSLLDNKVHNKKGLEDFITNVPVLAEIPKLGRKEPKLTTAADRSILTESLRILRENLEYLIKSKKGGEGKKKKNIVFVTSSVPEEGKTFVTANLARMIAATNKKVLLVGADIRNPKISDFFPSTKETGNDDRVAGLTDYILGDVFGAHAIIESAAEKDLPLDVVYSGKIPPNPTELLSHPKVAEFFAEVSKKYDYVLVDTAPIMPVSDTLLLSKFAHQVLYVVRAGATDKKVLDFPLKLKKEKKLPNLAFVVNGVKAADLGYGGKYGYGYGTQKSFFKRMFS